MSIVLPFQRRATIEDYNWNDSIGAYVLSFDNRFRPGVISSSPAIGMLEYNHYLERPKPNYNQDNKEEIRKFLANVIEGNLDMPFLRIARLALLNYFSPDKYPQFNQLSTDELSQLSDEQTALLLDCFVNSSILRKMLTPTHIAKLKFAGI